MIFIIFFFLFFMFLVFGIIVPIYKKHTKITGNVINYDFNMKKFVYKVNLSNQEMINLLKAKNESNTLSCEFDFNKSIINFSEYGSNIEYYYDTQEYEDFLILRLEQAAFIGMQSQIPYKLNPFMVSKLQAEIIPFSQYGF